MKRSSRRWLNSKRDFIARKMRDGAENSTTRTDAFTGSEREEKASAHSGRNDSFELFVAAVKRGIASAERGDLVEHAEVMTRIERILQS